MRLHSKFQVGILPAKLTEIKVRRIGWISLHRFNSTVFSFDNSLEILLEFFWNCHWLLTFSKVNRLLTFSKPADYLHFQIQLIAYTFKVNSLFTFIKSAGFFFFFHFKSQLITKSNLNMKGIVFCQDFA